jgi:hypothetical protein
MSRMRGEPPERPLLTNDRSKIVSAEYWLVVFFDFVSGQKFRTYARLGSLINAVDDHFGWRKLHEIYGQQLPEYHVWHIDLNSGKAVPVDGPLWRP